MKRQRYMTQRNKTGSLIRPLIAVSGTVGAVAVIVWLIRRYGMPVRETEIQVAGIAPAPNESAPKPSGSRPLQLLDDGEGDLYHRVYQIDMVGATRTSEQLMAQIYVDVNMFVPTEMMRFDKMRGSDDGAAWKIGDEFYIRVTGPWDAPVRVIETEPTRFALLTLADHFEAGEIHFSFSDHPERDDAIRFQIESWARSRDTITDFVYRVLGLSKFAQTRVWTYFCKRVQEESGGERLGVIHVTTHKARYEPEQPIPSWRRYQRDFERWRTTDLNFDPAQRETYNEGTGWRVDDYSTGLPSEPPGEPIADGSWQRAKTIIQNYEFPDPGLITGIFVPDDPLDERIMILRARFLIFTFLFGVKIVDVREEVREIDKRGAARVWGYSYQTLKGHFERGEIRFEILKFIDSGEVEFRVHAYSHSAEIENVLYKIGFWVFGRRLQRRFARTSLSRMQQLVIARQAEQVGAALAETAPEAIPDPAASVESISTDADASEKADAIKAES